MKSHARFAVFSLVSSVIYVLAYDFNWPMFRYYPLVRQWTLDPLPKVAGPAMLYYGWLATAALVGLAVAIIVPNRFAARLPPNAAWVIPLALIAFTLVYEKHWFL
jgi:hypothetical protein